MVAKIIFPVDDMARTVEFYRSLGFEVEAYDDSYAWVRHRGHEILHLALVDDLTADTNPSAGYLHVSDVGAWNRAWLDVTAARAAIVEPLGDRPWGMRELALRDPAGNRLRIGQNL